jgi:hypothetical protein
MCVDARGTQEEEELIFLMMGNWGFNSQQGLDFSLLCNVQTGSGTLPTSYSVTIIFFLDVKWLGCETDYSSPSSSEVMIRWS